MNCQEARTLLPRSLDEQLAGDQQALLGSHLDGCQDCATEQAGQARLDALLDAALADHPFGDAAVERILGALPAKPGAAEPRWGVQRVATWVAAAAAVLLGVVLLNSDAPQQADAPTTAQVVAHTSHGTWMRLGAEATTEPLEGEHELRVGEQFVALTTPATLSLPDGTRVDVHADTELTLRRDDDGGLAVVLESDGRVFCEVAKRDVPFRVVTRELTVEVLGTRFAVDQEVSISRVVVVEGRVQASSGGDRRVLTANQGAELRLGLQRLEPLQVTARDWIRWLPRVATEPAPATSPAVPVERPSPQPTASQQPAQPSPRPSPTDPSLDTPILPPGRDGLPGND